MHHTLGYSSSPDSSRQAKPSALSMALWLIRKQFCEGKNSRISVKTQDNKDEEEKSEGKAYTFSLFTRRRLYKT